MPPRVRLPTIGLLGVFLLIVLAPTVQAAVHPAAAPTVGWTVSPTVPTAGVSASFFSSVSGGTPPYSYAWAFGDHGTSTAADPTHTFAKAGSYSVWLNVTDDDGLQTNVNHVVLVASTPGPLHLTAPTNLEVTGQTTGSISLAWTLPVTKVTNVTVRYGTSCSALIDQRSAGNVTTYTVNGLVSGQFYCFRAEAWNGSAHGPNSSTAVGDTLTGSNGGGGGGGGGSTPPVQVPYQSRIEAFIAPVAILLVAVGAVFVVGGLASRRARSRG